MSMHTTNKGLGEQQVLSLSFASRPKVIGFACYVLILWHAALAQDLSNRVNQ